MDYSFWKKQTASKPLFPDIEWSKPQQKNHAGKLAVVGGNKLGFMAVGEAYMVAKELGTGQVRAIMPDALKRTIPAAITDAYFVPSNVSGGFSREALPELMAALPVPELSGILPGLKVLLEVCPGVAGWLGPPPETRRRATTASTSATGT